MTGAAVALSLAPLERSATRGPTPEVSPTVPEAPAALAIVSPAEGAVLGGNVVEVLLDAPGASRTSFFVFADRDPPPEGTVMRPQRGVAESPHSLVTIGGLRPGRHRLTAVPAGRDARRLTSLVARVSVTMTGPFLTASAAATSIEGDPWTIRVSVSGVHIVSADGDRSGKTGHLHFMIDLDLPPTGVPIPLDAENVVHTTETVVPIAGLAAGPHHVWIVIGDGTHRPLAPYVADEVFVTVTL